MKTNPYLSTDRLVNAANSSTRSYMTVSRPVANNSDKIGSRRPASSGMCLSSSLYHAMLTLYTLLSEMICFTAVNLQGEDIPDKRP